MNGGIVMEWRDKIDDPIQEFGGRVMQELFQNFDLTIEEVFDLSEYLD